MAPTVAMIAVITAILLAKLSPRMGMMGGVLNMLLVWAWNFELFGHGCRSGRSEWW
jgi:uncharacterized membrane protein YGL010W